MKNKVRFFIDKEKDACKKYYDAPIPQRKSIVFLDGEKFIVNNIIYRYNEFAENFYIDALNLIDVYVEHMEDENFE